MDEQLKKNALEYHRRSPPGKISILPTKQVTNQRDLALAYSPGVAAACEEIEHRRARCRARAEAGHDNALIRERRTGDLDWKIVSADAILHVGARVEDLGQGVVQDVDVEVGGRLPDTQIEVLGPREHDAVGEGSDQD